MFSSAAGTVQAPCAQARRAGSPRQPQAAAAAAGAEPPGLTAHSYGRALGRHSSGAAPPAARCAPLPAAGEAVRGSRALSQQLLPACTAWPRGHRGHSGSSWACSKHEAIPPQGPGLCCSVTTYKVTPAPVARCSPRPRPFRSFIAHKSSPRPAPASLCRDSATDNPGFPARPLPTAQVRSSSSCP